MLPDPVDSSDIDGLTDNLRRLKASCGDPSYETIARRVNQAWSKAGRPKAELTSRSTVAGYFSAGRRRLNEDLLMAIVAAMHADEAYVDRWRLALRAIRAEGAAFADVLARFPDEHAAFVGRDRQLDSLVDGLGRAAQEHTAVISINGMAGVGKTRFALHAAHRLLAHGYGTDLQLFVDLRGFDPRAEPADAFAVLGEFLRYLGLSGDQVPPTLSGRVDKYRDLIAGRRALIVLDNVADAGQVVSLLPRSRSCLTIVTSRRELDELPEANHLRLDVFTPDEALSLLRGITGSERIDGDRESAARVAELAGYLPLALVLVGAHIKDNPDWLLTDYVAPLTVLAMEGGVRAALALSDRSLPAGCKRLLRLIGGHPGPDIDVFAAAALTGQDLSTTRVELDALVAARLLQEGGPHRYRLHDLVRAYAVERLHLDEPSSRIFAARTGLLDYYCSVTSIAISLCYPVEADRRPQVPATPAETPILEAPETAQAWLAEERVNILAVANFRPENWPVQVRNLALILNRYLYVQGHLGDLETLLRHALRACGAQGATRERALILNSLGLARWRQGHLREAREYQEQALADARELGDLLVEGLASTGLGLICDQLGEYQLALELFEKALAVARALDQPEGVGKVLGNLGNVYGRLGRYEQSVECFEQALETVRGIGDKVTELVHLGNLGLTRQYMGEHAAARTDLQRSLELARELGDRVSQAYALNHLGSVYLGLKEPARALDHYSQGLVIAQDVGSLVLQADILNGLGAATRAGGDPQRSHDHHQQALSIARGVGERYEQARAIEGIAEALLAMGQPDQAADNWRQALTLYSAIGLPDAARVKGRIAELSGGRTQGG